MKLTLLSLWLLVQAASLCHAAENSAQHFRGQWIGEARTSTERTRLSLHIHAQGSELNARMTLNDVGVMGWPAKRVKQVAGGIELVFPSDSGDQVMQFSLASDGADVADATHPKQLKGTWTDNRFQEPATVIVTKAPNEESAIERVANIQGPDGRLSAAVVLPAGRGPHPGVVFLHGSGPQPKDASRFAAHELAKYGIASLIYDKRGVGQSEGKWVGASFEDLADDGVAAARYMLSLDEVSSVGFWGHSQGGWIGPLAATQWPETAFVITSAGPAVPPSREAHWGFIRKLRSSESDTSAEQDARKIIELWHEGIRTGEWTALDAAIRTARQTSWFAASGLEYFSKRPDKNFVDSYRESMDHRPVPILKRLKAPLLAILAPDDESIDARETEEILRSLIRAGNEIRIKLYPGFDHGLRRLGKENQLLRWPGHPDDYFSAQAEFIREVAQARASKG